ncbi:SDR family NAD(P)-dependent oxidoreductase [Granulosicoccus sp. 3-233]|uniref:SDR family NAD(P)-dependent oxidoreductase n=1 Tax=Granulosicoccus sp. 3-233 TaxID=3417969 RepID=UPI003D332718
MKKNILIVGGSSGLGLDLARHYVREGHGVCLTGRHDPGLSGARYVELDIDADGAHLNRGIDQLLENFPVVNTLIYSAGFCQRATIDGLSTADITQMVNVGLVAPMLLVQRLKNHLDTPLKVMLITSSSQYTARETEPVYCATKAGLGMFGACLALDRKVGKVLVAAPSGMKSPFWRHSDNDVSEMLETQWVAARIVELSSGAFKYKFAKILRNPQGIVVEECLDDALQPIECQ